MSTQPRVHVTIRVRPSATTWADDLAHRLTTETGGLVTRSDVLRTAVAIGKAHQPEIEQALKDRT